MYNKVVVTLDGSELAERTLPHAEAIARGLGVELVLLHVVPFPAVHDAGVEGELEEIDRMYLEGLAQDLKTRGVDTEVEVLWGEVAPEIVDYVREHKGALLVMATHGRTGLSRLAYGSVTESVLHEARTTPVLVVRSLDGAGPERS
jgi:nucleotide-binding universal stress UspA family protein